MNMSRAVVRASIPPIQTGLNFDGAGGVRVKLDIPEQDAIEATKLVGMRGVILRVTFEIEKDSDDSEYGGRLK